MVRPGRSPRDRIDTLYFENGQFWSSDCIRDGFSPAPYWFRFDEEGIHFRAELESSDNGTASFVGVVRDGTLQATNTWRKDRWYWSIHQKFRFEGSLIESGPLAAGENEVRLPATADPRAEQVDAD